MNKKVLTTFGIVALSSILLTGCKGSSGSKNEPTTPMVEVFTVTFHNEGNIFNIAEVADGNKVAQPSDPTKAATEYHTYTFSGWYTASDEAYDFETPVTADLDLYAKYIEHQIEVTVTFVNEGVTYASSVIAKGAKVAKPDDPSKAANEDYRYEFAGWKLNDNLYDFDTSVMDDITLVASYTEIALRYKVTYIVDGATYLEDYVNAGEVATKPTDPTKEDSNGYRYTFNGWFTSDDVEYAFNTPVNESFTLYASFMGAPITYTATVSYGYGDGPEDKTFNYTIYNKDSVLESIKAALPNEDSVYEYAFTNLPDELPLQSKTYVINRTDKSFEENFNDNQPCEYLSYLNREGSENNESFESGAYTVKAGNNVLITDKKYQYFDLEFDVKITDMTQPRLTLVLGLDDTQVDKVYDAVYNTVGADAFMINGGASNNVRYYKGGAQSAALYSTINPTPDYANEFINVKLSVYKDSFTLVVDGKNVLLGSNEIAPKLGHIYLSRADYLGKFTFDNFKVAAHDGEKPVAAKTFEEDFEGTSMTDQLVWNPRSGEPDCEIADGALKCQFTNGNLHTAQKYTDFDLRTNVMIGSGRFTVEFGADETNMGYVGGRSVEGGATGLMFCMDGGSNPVQCRYFSNASSSTSYTTIYNAKNADTLALRLNGLEYVSLHVQVMDGTVTVEIGDETVMDQVALGSAHEGYIVFARGNGDGSLTTARFDNISVTDYDL